MKKIFLFCSALLLLFSTGSAFGEEDAIFIDDTVMQKPELVVEKSKKEIERAAKKLDAARKKQQKNEVKQVSKERKLKNKQDIISKKEEMRQNIENQRQEIQAQKLNLRNMKTSQAEEFKQFKFDIKQNERNQKLALKEQKREMKFAKKEEEYNKKQELKAQKEQAKLEKRMAKAEAEPTKEVSNANEEIQEPLTENAVDLKKTPPTFEEIDKNAISINEFLQFSEAQNEKFSVYYYKTTSKLKEYSNRINETEKRLKAIKATGMQGEGEYENMRKVEQELDLLLEERDSYYNKQLRNFNSILTKKQALKWEILQQMGYRFLPEEI